MKASRSCALPIGSAWSLDPLCCALILRLGAQLVASVSERRPEPEPEAAL